MDTKQINKTRINYSIMIWKLIMNKMMDKTWFCKKIKTKMIENLKSHVFKITF